MGPSEVSDLVLENLKKSNLHFILSENHFSAKITINKKFLNNLQVFRTRNRDFIIKETEDYNVEH